MSNSNDFSYANEFDGNLRADSQPVPVKVTTRLCVMNEHTADQIRNHSSNVFGKKPTYVFGGGTLQVHPGKQAMGLHFFTW